jgi:hypothetical protein
MVGPHVAAYIPLMNLELLFLHSSGLGWDEALVVLGGLAILTAVLLTRLRGSEPVAEPAQAERDVTPKPTRRRKR